MEPDFAAWAGRSVTRHDVATPRLLAEYRATLSPFLFDADTAICPPGFHFGLAPATPGTEDTGPDGAERKGLFLPPLPLPRRMWAGGSIRTLRPLREGARITRTASLADIRVRQGSSGQLCLVSIDHAIADEHGLAIAERQELVFRAASPVPVPPAGPARPLAADWQVEGTPLLLFRFSAFTFNGHRIHYDLSHCAEEGYPGLLVHGPMQAALMLNLAASRLGAVPDQFGYRCLAPLYGGSSFGVAWDGEARSVRIIRSDGVITAEGTVRPGGGQAALR